jgi:hypothetical protein
MEENHYKTAWISTSHDTLEVAVKNAVDKTRHPAFIVNRSVVRHAA